MPGVAEVNSLIADPQPMLGLCQPGTGESPLFDHIEPMAAKFDMADNIVFFGHAARDGDGNV